MSRMLKEASKAVVFVSTSAIVIPYAVAFLANVLCGWPQGKNKYQRAFNPHKVYALNYAILQQLGNIRFAKLYFMWKIFYNNDENEKLIKDIRFGTNENKLDVYLPQNNQGHALTSDPHPVVVFVYGGAWGSGDKNMYGLLCDQLANNLQAVVCCPNYSIYPRGCVDDMVQDVVDCMSWIHSNIHEFGGNKHCIMLVGHSAGAHLCSMAVLELTMKRLLHNPLSVIGAEGSPVLPSVLTEAMPFEDQHFDGSKSTEGVSGSLMRRSLGGTGESSTGSFYVVSSGNGNGNGNGNGDSGNGRPGSVGDNGNSDSFILVSDKDNGGNKNNAASLDTKTDAVEAMSDDEKKDEGNEKEDKIGEDSVSDKFEGVEGEDTLLKSLDASITEPLEVDVESDANISRSQKEVRDVLSSVRAVIGLAGVYDIGDHFEHETWRGIEDISAMCRAMYGPENFNRFSPSWIAGNLPGKTRLPPFQLVHGEDDLTVPVTSSVKFSQMIHNLGAESSLVVLPECHHADICLDLMDPTRTHHDPVMGLILEMAQRYLNV